MGDPHRVQYDLFRARTGDYITDPGPNLLSIFIDRDLAVVPLNVSTSGGESRTLIQPDRGGVRCLLAMRTSTAALTLTVQGTYDGTNSVITVPTSSQGAFMCFESELINTTGSANVQYQPEVYQWRLIYQQGIPTLPQWNVKGGFIIPSTGTVNATTTGTANAGLLTNQVNFVNPSAAGYYFKLPAASLGLNVKVINTVGSSAILIGASINGATSVAIASSGGASSVWDLVNDGTNWWLD